jgi:abhydrolase domain-containing protein 13
MQLLYELSTTPRKIWKPLPGGDHNSSVLEEGYFESIADFIAEVTEDSGIQDLKEKQHL